MWPRARAIGVLDVEEGGGGFAPGVHIGGRPLFAPGVDFALGSWVGGEEGSQVRGANHAVDERCGIRDEDAMDGFALH